MSELIEMLCKGNVIVQLNNGNQEREFRNICKELNKKYGNINLSHKDGTAYKDTENEKKPIYPLFHNFHKYGEQVYIGWSLYGDSFGTGILMTFKNFKQNVKMEERKA